MCCVQKHDVFPCQVPWLRCRKSTPFTKCGLCEYLVHCIYNAAQGSGRVKLMNRLALHHSWQGAQRKCLDELIEQSRRTPLDLVVFSIDKLDQQKSIVPHSHSMRTTAFFKQGNRFVVGLVGVLIYALTNACYCFSTLENHSHGSSFQCSLLLDIVVLIHRSLGRLPTRLIINADNTYKETKNTITLFWIAWLLANSQGSGLIYVEMVFLMAGHTHGPVDRWFALAMAALRGQSYMTLPRLFGLLEARMKDGVFWAHARDVYAWKEARPPWTGIDATRVKGIGLPHAFRLHVDRSGACIIETKRWMSDPIYGAPHVLLDATGMTRLRGWEPPASPPSWDRTAAAGRTPVRDGLLSWLQKLEVLMHTSKIDNFTPEDLELLRQVGMYPAHTATTHASQCFTDRHVTRTAVLLCAT